MDQASPGAVYRPDGTLVPPSGTDIGTTRQDVQ